MSSPSHLPPRCPVHRSDFVLGSTFRTAQRDIWLSTDDRLLSQGSFLEEEASWLDNLSINPKTSTTGVSLRRSASDPVALLEASSNFRSIVYPGCEVNSISTMEGSETDCDLETSCINGPNSPRQKNELTYLESVMVSALLENVSQNSYQHLREDCPAGSRIVYSDNAHNSSCHHIPGKTSRRRSRQRSRVRKLQYMSDLGRLLMHIRIGRQCVASLFQQHAILSIENKKLKQQILSLQQQKMIKNGQYQHLKSELERLKTLYERLLQSKKASNLRRVGTSRHPVLEPVGRLWIWENLVLVGANDDENQIENRLIDLSKSWLQILLIGVENLSKVKRSMILGGKVAWTAVDGVSVLVVDALANKLFVLCFGRGRRMILYHYQIENKIYLLIEMTENFQFGPVLRMKKDGWAIEKGIQGTRSMDQSTVSLSSAKSMT